MSPIEFTAYVALGSNLKGRWSSSQEVLALACDHLRNTFGQELVCSSLFTSSPFEAEGPAFVNAVVCFKTRRTPAQILQELHAIETFFGRERPYPNAPRILDLDLLTCQWSDPSEPDTNPIKDFQSATPSLMLPHPRLHQRAFVVAPLAQIAPTFAISGLGNVQQWLDKTKEQAVAQL